MSAEGPARSFAELERTGWQRVADRYETAWSGLTRLFIPALLDAVGAGPGARLLDVACGPGYVAEAAQARGIMATGADFSRQMARIARRRLPALPVVVGDALALPIAGAAFDAVAMNFGLLHLPDPDQAFASIRRVLRRGGRLAFTIWAGPEHSPGGRIADAALQAHANLTVAVPAGPDFTGRENATSWREILGHFGFEPASLTFRTITAAWQVPTAHFVFEAERDAGVRKAALLREQQPAALEAIANQMAESYAPYRTAAGYAIPYAAHLIGANAR